MASRATVSATFPPHVLGKVAYFADLVGATKYQVMRYLAYLAAGHTPADAKALAIPDHDMGEFTGDIRRSHTKIDQAILDEIKKRHPGRDIGWILRYHAAMQTPGIDEDFAVDIADSIKPGRPRKQPPMNT
jgi:hypothetical protein